jgi:hypothetical protein
MSAAGAEAGPPNMSRGVAMLHAPMGKSVSIGRSGWPMAVPLRTLRTGRACTARPTALARVEATPSSRSKRSIAATTEFSGFPAAPWSGHS